MTHTCELVRLDPSGDTTPCSSGYEALRAAIGGTLEVVTPNDTMAFWCGDEAMFERLPLNVVASLFAGSPIYGPVVLSHADVDEEGETLPPLDADKAMVVMMGRQWFGVVGAAALNGQDPYTYADPDNMGPPMVFTGHEASVLLGLDWLDEDEANDAGA